MLKGTYIGQIFLVSIGHMWRHFFTHLIQSSWLHSYQCQLKSMVNGSQLLKQFYPVHSAPETKEL